MNVHMAMKVAVLFNFVGNNGIIAQLWTGCK